MKHFGLFALVPLTVCLLLTDCTCEGGNKVAVVDAGDIVSPVAHLEYQRGEVFLERGGIRSPAAMGYLYIRDALETGASSEARVRLGGGRILELGPGARLVVGEDKTGLVLEVARGLVLTRVPADAGAPNPELRGDLAVSILTPFGLTRVGGGSTDLSLDVGVDGAKLDVRVGSVELLSRAGETSRAEAGDKVSLSAGKVEFAERAPKEISLSAIEVVLSEVTGKVEVKRAGQRSFGQVGKTPMTLSVGDSVRVKGGMGALSMAQSTTKAAINSGAELSFEGAARADGVEETHLSLRSGNVSLSLPADHKSRVDLGGLSLESDLGGQFTVNKTKDGFEATARVGDAKLHRADGSEQLLAAGQRVKFPNKGDAAVEELARAELVLPSRPGLRVFHPGIAEAAITWESKDQENEWLVLALDSNFTQVLMAGTVHGTWANIPIPPKGSLYWRVQSSGGHEIDRGSAYFAPEPQQKDLARLRNEVPEGTDTTTIFFQDKPPAVTFTFGARPDASTYRIAVYRTSNLSSPVAERSVSTPPLALEAGALIEGSYRWSVTPVLADGSEGEGGRMNKLEMVYDNSVPQLIVRSPRNGDRAGGRTDAAGVAPVGSKLLINGKSVALDEKHRFDTQVIPLGRGALVIFRMTRPSEPEVFTVRELRRGR